MSPPPPISAASPEFRRINRAMVFGGFSTFALLYCVQPLMPLLYCVQPLMPLLARDFALTPAQSSLALSPPPPARWPCRCWRPACCPSATAASR